jgi:hypothetical protein
VIDALGGCKSDQVVSFTDIVEKITKYLHSIDSRSIHGAGVGRMDNHRNAIE